MLTPSELQVARLAAEGHANKAIAQTLCVSLRTVETYLTHTYAKLGISTRRALSAALAGGVGPAAGGRGDEKRQPASTGTQPARVAGSMARHTGKKSRK